MGTTMNNKNPKQAPSIFIQVTTLLEQYLDMSSSRWSYKTSLEEVGIDSINIVDLIFILEDEFQIELGFQHYFAELQWKTIGALVSAVEQQLAGQDNHQQPYLARAA